MIGCITYHGSASLDPEKKIIKHLDKCPGGACFTNQKQSILMVIRENLTKEPPFDTFSVFKIFWSGNTKTSSVIAAGVKRRELVDLLLAEQGIEPIRLDLKVSGIEDYN